MSECEMLTWAYNYFGIEEDIWTVNRTVFVSKMQQYKGRVGWQCLRWAFQTFFQQHEHHGAMLTTFLLIILPKHIYNQTKKQR